MRVVQFSENKDEVLKLYEQGLPGSSLTGWASVDRFYKVGPAQFTVVTGVPSHGKSEWLDALLVNLLDRPCNGKMWRFIVCSPENWPLALHQAKLLEKITQRKFWSGYINPPRLTREEVELQTRILGGRFTFLEMEDTEGFPELMLAAHELASSEPGYQLGIVLDPWNQLEHKRPQWMSETEYISQALSYANKITRDTNAHLWIVAHPTKMQRLRDGTRPVPTLYDISGSAHWYNKADNGITIWRDTEDAQSRSVQIHIQKVRFRHNGRIGQATLKYEPAVGIYRETDED